MDKSNWTVTRAFRLRKSFTKYIGFIYTFETWVYNIKLSKRLISSLNKQFEDQFKITQIGTVIVNIWLFGSLEQLITGRLA